jgi:hypothetical protein
MSPRQNFFPRPYVQRFLTATQCMSGAMASEIHTGLTSYQAVPGDCFLDDDAFRQLVRRVHMASEQRFDCPLIQFDLGTRSCHCNTHRHGRLLDQGYRSARVSVVFAFRMGAHIPISRITAETDLYHSTRCGGRIVSEVERGDEEQMSPI